TRSYGDWSSDVCSSDLAGVHGELSGVVAGRRIVRYEHVDPNDPRRAGGHVERKRVSLLAEVRVDVRHERIGPRTRRAFAVRRRRSEEHTSELQSPYDLV